jgi:hypothetical protein
VIVGRAGESPGRVALGDGDLRVRKSSVTDKIQFERLETRSGLQQCPEPRPQSVFRKPRRKAGFRDMIRPRPRPANALLILSGTVSGRSVAPREQYPSSRSALLTCTDRANRAFRFRCRSSPAAGRPYPLIFRPVTTGSPRRLEALFFAGYYGRANTAARQASASPTTAPPQPGTRARAAVRSRHDVESPTDRRRRPRSGLDSVDPSCRYGRIV